MSVVRLRLCMAYPINSKLRELCPLLPYEEMKLIARTRGGHEEYTASYLTGSLK